MEPTQQVVGDLSGASRMAVEELDDSRDLGDRDLTSEAVDVPEKRSFRGIEVGSGDVCVVGGCAEAGNDDRQIDRRDAGSEPFPVEQDRRTVSTQPPVAWFRVA